MYMPDTIAKHRALLPPPAPDVPLRALRPMAACWAYEAGLEAVLEHEWTPSYAERRAALLAVGYGTILLPLEDRAAALSRLHTWSLMAGFKAAADCYALTVGIDAEEHLEKTGLSLIRAREIVFGTVVGLSTLTRELSRAERLHQITVDPQFRLDGFMPFMNFILFDIKPQGRGERAAADAAVESTAPVADPVAAPISHTGEQLTIEALVSRWIVARGAGGSEASRRKAAATIFFKAAGLMRFMSASLLSVIGQTAVRDFHHLMLALGAGWGTVAPRLDKMTGAEILRLASSDPKPKWAQTGVSKVNAAGHVGRAQDFLRYAESVGIAVPTLDWRAVEKAIEKMKDGK